MLCCCTNDFQFFTSAAYGLSTPGQFERLADPLGDRHVARTRNALNLAVFRILQNYLQSLSHRMSLYDS